MSAILLMLDATPLLAPVRVDGRSGWGQAVGDAVTSYWVASPASSGRQILDGDLDR